MICSMLHNRKLGMCLNKKANTNIKFNHLLSSMSSFFSIFLDVLSLVGRYFLLHAGSDTKYILQTAASVDNKYFPLPDIRLYRTNLCLLLCNFGPQELGCLSRGC